MIKIGYRFFRFYDEANNKSYVIPLHGNDEYITSEWYHAGLDEDFYYDNILPRLEARDLEVRYGIHDFDTHGPDMIIGYTSYEVEAVEFPALMEEWCEILREVGFSTSAVEIYDGEV